MNTPDPELLADLDARAARAVSALDEEVAAAAVPDFTRGSHRSRGRSRRPLLFTAAGLVAVTVVAAAVVVTRDDADPDDGLTVTGVDESDDDLTHLVLADPAAFGLETFLAFDLEVGLPDGLVDTEADPDGTDPVATVYGPADADDPWSAAVVVMAEPVADESSGTVMDGPPSGETVDLGGIEGVRTTSTYGHGVSWTDRGRSNLILSGRLDQELVDLARAIVASDGGLDAGIPGYEPLYSGRMHDVAPLLIGMTADDVRGVYYRSRSERHVMQITFMPASESRQRAAVVLARETEETTVRGNTATLASFSEVSDMFSELSWVENGTFVRMTGLSDGSDPIDLVAMAETLEEIDSSAFGDLMAETSAAVAEMIDDASASTGDIAVPLATAELVRGETTFATTVGETEDGALRLKVGARTGSSDGGAIDSIENTSVDNVMYVSDHAAVGGMLGPDLRSIEVIDATTGDPVTVVDHRIVPIPGSDRSVFIAVLDVDDLPAPSTTCIECPPASLGGTPLRVEVIGTLGDGTRVRVAAQ